MIEEQMYRSRNFDIRPWSCVLNERF